MAISPPGDILLEVARAAVPEQAEAARARLQSLAKPDTPFEDPAVERTAAVRAEPAGTGVPESFMRFEALVLESFMQSMLPAENDAVFGGGLSGEMWRGLLAQQLGETLAKRGGIGIAERILGDHYLVDGRKVPLAGVSSGPEAEHAAEQATLSTALVQDIEREAFKALVGDRSAEEAK